MKVYLIRHGMTKGNKEGRYVGHTDEELSKEGKDKLTTPFPYSSPQIIYASPLKRCLMTAEILYPNVPIRMTEDLKECDFGEFEYKNYSELNGNPDYQRFIDEGGECGFPGGEDKSTFCRRICKAFVEVMEEAVRKNYEEIAFVVHGGTIMAILETFGIPKSSYYSWQVSNGKGFLAECDIQAWRDGDRRLVVHRSESNESNEGNEGYGG